MPRELRSVAESFNAMTDHALERAHALRGSLSENRALMLEMHHRIKNSLQVIQSYLALIRRSAARPEAALLARIEARVGVLAVAYRLALTPNGIRPMAAKPFLEEICAAAIGGLAQAATASRLRDRMERRIAGGPRHSAGPRPRRGADRGVRRVDAGYVGVRLAAGEDGAVELRVESDAVPAEADLPQKVMRGLANQLGAEPLPRRGGEIFGWRFHRRDAMIAVTAVDLLRTYASSHRTVLRCSVIPRTGGG